MKTHDFVLSFTYPTAGASVDDLIERLGEAGCTDSTVGIGQPGRVVLAFDREAESAFEAVSTAIADVKKAIPDARLDETMPDIFGPADREGFARAQTYYELAKNLCAADFVVSPEPIPLVSQQGG